jgi:hypothetical protein
MQCTIGARFDLMIRERKRDEYSGMPLTLSAFSARAGTAARKTHYVILADGRQEG